MIEVLGLPGSLRQGSFNAALLRAAVELTPAGTRIEVGSIRGVPLYDGDVEAREGIPAAVQALKERIVATHALLIVTPEYNSSIPGVLKNAIDWLSRPGSDIPRLFHGRVVGIIGATPGGHGTAFAQVAWLPVLRVLGTRPYFGGSLYVAGAGKAFDTAGRLVDDAVRERLTKYLDGFARCAIEARGGG